MTHKQILIIKSKVYSSFFWEKEYKGTITIIKDRLGELGWFSVYMNYKKNIEISESILDKKYLVDTVLIHELCHWWCFINKVGWDDVDEDFQKESARVGDKDIFSGDADFTPSDIVKELTDNFERSFYEIF
jgi:hypothetical protein